MEKAANYEIEPIGPEDLDEIVAIENVSYPSPWPKQIFEREIEAQNSYKRIIRFSGSVVAYIVTWTVHDEVHILNIAVHPDFRKIGLGEMLLRDCLGFSFDRELKLAVLEVRTSNNSAIKLYEKIGFKTLRVRKKYYSDTGEDAYVMLYELESEKE
ncbi:MAG: ribosomal protein S18-alanine N-acetyltransferase [Candidatus Dadabacteria bacterium]|jgi:ribosomal-protein-alanine N-acetyltransferase